ncbi:glycosyltransferase family A protein [Snodgrassella alvi]|uniref:glycosyltransferase family A protein n=1 Tax=Snodgrassella alvi TaxID=1196083 RepID=UPI003D02BB93
MATALSAKNSCRILASNRGPALARNWGALLSASSHIAFLDVDDAYQPYALQAACAVFHFRPQSGLLRLPVTGYNIPEKYREHEQFDLIWRTFEMITATNTVFNRAYFLACGGFPADLLFRQLGGEDGALGLATIESCMVATLFDKAGMTDIGVNFYGHDSMYVCMYVNCWIRCCSDRHILIVVSLRCSKPMLLLRLLCTVCMIYVRY